MKLDVDFVGLAPGEPAEKVRAAASRFLLEEAEGPTDPTFATGYELLEAYFAPLGEIERRSVHERFITERRHVRPPFELRYHMVVARDEQGAIAGARNCTVALCAESKICVVFLAHALVMRPYRRSGLAGLLRLLPVQFGREAIQSAGLDIDAVDLLLSLEQEPVDAANIDSVVRLCAYGRSCFSVIDPAVLPYCQPDFRDLDALREPAVAVPLLAVVRWVGHEHEKALPARLCEAYARHLYDGIHARHCRPQDLEPLREFALNTLAHTSLSKAPLLRLPSHPDDEGALSPLRKERVLPLFAPILRR
ncbi:hypothetical protein [Chondromyces crocatus]|uniref:Uncharacterized protein n=1 Tax=Chondromyces crocatus TaxID=52 RepID=A0A0K1EG24_CHOCO|nr:hypothetical protein [Chondromyces crocatus]AKT39632.1 uncharacterized protein CMC5_037810 [Chondromyces crocatus]